MKKLLVLAACALFVGRVAAAPVSQADAKHAVEAWLATAPVLGGEEIQRITPANVVSYEDDDGTVLFHVVSLEEGGFVLTAADDSISPILLYSTAGSPPDEDSQDPFWALAVMSVRSQMAAAEAAREWTDDPKADALGESAPVSPRDEWAALLDVDLEKLDAVGNPAKEGEVSDVRVDRILMDGAATHAYQLTQSTAYEANANWNYTTTYKYANISQRYGADFAAKNYANWPWGCGVVAVAKVLMYWGYPDPRPAGFSYQPPTALSGYDWTYIAGGTARISDVALLSDVGEAMGARYEYSVSDGKMKKEGSTDDDAPQSALKGRLGYANVEFLARNGGVETSTFQRILGSNLDAKCPVIIGVARHNLVADGYGYIGNALYYHLDLGWGGLSSEKSCSWNYWWRLPSIPISVIGYTMGDYNSILDLTYNIFPLDNDCQIISGRTVGPAGDGCLASVSISGPGANVCTYPDSNGIFYFLVPKGSGTYKITAQYLLESKTRTVQLDGNNLNYWGCDFAFDGGYTPGGYTPGGYTPGGFGSTYKVKFLPNGGKGKMSSQRMTYGKASKLKANKFKRKGYVFLGWAKKKKGAVVYKNKQTVANLMANGGTVKLYAKWGKKVVITFNPNGGTLKKKSKKATTGRKLGSLPKPTRKGRSFEGWWTKRTGGKRLKASSVVSKSITLYARWGSAALPNGGPYTKKVNGIVWQFTVSKGKATVTGIQGNPSLPKPLRIPSKLGGRTVASIGSNAFYVQTKMTTVAIPSSVKDIGYQSFGYSGLTSITIPNSVTSIGDRAFAGCSALTSIAIPDSVTSIGKEAFWGCSELAFVTIGNNVRSLGGYSFQCCPKLRSVTIGNSVTSISSQAFSGCSELTSITIGNSVTDIGMWSFSGCSALRSITIPDSVTDIGGYAFYGSGLTSISIPSHLQSQVASWYLPSSCQIIVR